MIAKWVQLPALNVKFSKDFRQSGQKLTKKYKIGLDDEQVKFIINVNDLEQISSFLSEKFTKATASAQRRL